MLRALVLLFLLLNGAFFAWSHGWLSAWIQVSAEPPHEPERLAKQVQAERITVLTPHGTASEPLTPASVAASASDAASAVSTAPSAAGAASVASASSTASATTASAGGPGLCVEAGPFGTDDMAGIDKALRTALPTDSWTHQVTAVGGQWMVYMGPYADDDLYARKLNELRRIRGLNFEEVKTPAAFAQGLSLGRYGSQADADHALAAARLRGIRTARVVTVRPKTDVHMVRVPQASVTMQVTLSGMKLPQGKSFSACRS